MDYLNISFWEQFNIINYHWLQRYIDFIRIRIELGERNLQNYEKHHIVPNSFIQNSFTIPLTLREHFIAHKILARCFSGKYGYSMIHALNRMMYSHNGLIAYSSKDYEELRMLYLNMPFPDETRRKMSERKKNTKFSQEWCENISKGKLGWKPSDETRRKMSEAKKGKHPWNYGIKMWENKQPPMLGKSMSSETKQKIINSLKEHYKKYNSPLLGKKPSDETRRKMSDAKKGKCNGENNSFYGKHHTDEFKQYMSEKMTGYKFSKEHNDKISQSLKGNKRALGCKHSDEWKLEHSKRHLGTVGINKNGINKKIKKENLNEYLSLGWQLGFCKTK